jgi:hypothetical protein
VRSTGVITISDSGGKDSRASGAVTAQEARAACVLDRVFVDGHVIPHDRAASVA